MSAALQVGTPELSRFDVRADASAFGNVHLGHIWRHQPAAVRRARLVAGLEPWARARPQYRLKLGPAALPFDALSDEALADLRSRIAGDVRRERSLRRG